MKQVIQNYRTGRLEIIDAPVPLCRRGSVLVRNHASLISVGTERSIIETAGKSLLGKARARPDLVKQVMDKAGKEGYLKTFREILNRMDDPVPLGYSSAGVVVEAGADVRLFSPGDRVACIGAGHACHAEFILVPENLCSRLPAVTSFEEASFGMLGAIALHGVRCAKLTFGESVAVIGLGLLGLLTVQILKAYGCKVIGADIDTTKIDWAKKTGIADSFTSEDDFKRYAKKSTGGSGVDAVIITASTKSPAPVHTAVEIARHGARIVVVGIADIHPERNEMWHKELEIIVSRGAGPGTLDPLYENQGVDYPPGYVRWTENRNLGKFLELVAEKRVNVQTLISHRFPVGDAEEVYKKLLTPGGEAHIGVVLEYPSAEDGAVAPGTRTLYLSEKSGVNSKFLGGQVHLGVIGAGLFGKAVFLPILKKTANAHCHTICTSSGMTAHHVARKYGFTRFTTDYSEIMNVREINAVMILTPHSMHAQMVLLAFSNGKHVFVEKPLCISEEELVSIISAHEEKRDLCLMVGYNRRFSPHTERILFHLSGRKDPLVIHYRINAGFIPSDHWVHSKEEGGGRVVGEICHFIDLMQYLTKSQVARVFAERVSGNNQSTVNNDNIVVTLKFRDGSVGDITYSAAGDKSFSREQIEIFSEGTTIISTDFKRTTLYRNGRGQSFKTLNQQIGYREELVHFIQAVLGKESLRQLPEEIFNSTEAVFCIDRSLETGLPVPVKY